MITKRNGNGQTECIGCKEEGKFALKWDSFLYNFNDKPYCWDCLMEEVNKLELKYDKALELLSEYNMPCEIDDFMNKNVEYCSKNCGVDEEIFKKCWDKFIEQELEKSDKDE